MKRVGDVTLVDNLPSMSEAMDSIPNTGGKKEGEKEEEKKVCPKLLRYLLYSCTVTLNG